MANNYEYFKEIQGDKALAWSHKESLKTEEEFARHPKYKQLTKEIFDILIDKRKIDYPTINDDADIVLNLWTDEKNIKGLLRRTNKENYLLGDPKWDTVLDIDKLCDLEGRNWVYHGSEKLKPNWGRMLVSLSDGGKDACEVREFDLESKKFVQDGFFVAEAKTFVTWIDKDTLVVASDFGEGTLTKSGYPRQLRLWKRGESMADAPIIFECGEDEMLVEIVEFESKKYGNVFIINQAIDFFHSKKYFFDINTHKVQAINIPDTSEVDDVFQKNLLVKLKYDWELPNNTKYKSGDLLAVSFDGKIVTPIYQPDNKTVVKEVVATDDTLYIVISNNITDKLFKCYGTRDNWQLLDAAILENTKKGSIEINHVNINNDELWYSYHDFLTPTTLFFYTRGRRDSIRSRPQYLASPDDYIVEQNFAKSPDGTEVPYFVIRNKRLNFSGENPTTLYGYGGYEVSLTPSYSALRKFVLEEGGVAIIANIRGGGEFGPEWHKAAQRKNKQKSYDDFIAIAEDLIARKITSPKYLRIEGGSNGGLLVAAVTVQRPDLFRAVSCQVPLTDMMEFHKLLAGHSWVAEYGNPDDTEEREIMLKYSPLQNLKPGKNYPKIFVSSSTADDRVHPYHARAFAKKLQDLGYDCYFCESHDGGHSGGADLKKSAEEHAREFVYFYKMTIDNNQEESYSPRVKRLKR